MGLSGAALIIAMARATFSLHDWWGRESAAFPTQIVIGVGLLALRKRVGYTSVMHELVHDLNKLCIKGHVALSVAMESAALRYSCSCGLEMAPHVLHEHGAHQSFTNAHDCSLVMVLLLSSIDLAGRWTQS